MKEDSKTPHQRQSRILNRTVSVWARGGIGMWIGE